MILKKYVPKYFEYFKPISFCNVVYIMNSKIIAKRLKFVLSLSILGEQFGFIDGRQIQKDIGISKKTFTLLA